MKRCSSGHVTPTHLKKAAVFSPQLHQIRLPVTSVHTGRVVAFLFTVSLGLTRGVLISIRHCPSRRSTAHILQDARPTFFFFKTCQKIKSGQPTKKVWGTEQPTSVVSLTSQTTRIPDVLMILAQVHRISFLSAQEKLHLFDLHF